MSKKIYHKKKRTGGVAQGVGHEFKPQYHNKKKVSGLTLRPLIHFLIILYRLKDGDLVSVSTRLYPVFPTTFVEEAFFSPKCIFGASVSS
jgi:hypothetical protein